MKICAKYSSDWFVDFPQMHYSSQSLPNWRIRNTWARWSMFDETFLWILKWVIQCIELFVIFFSKWLLFFWMAHLRSSKSRAATKGSMHCISRLLLNGCFKREIMDSMFFVRGIKRVRFLVFKYYHKIIQISSVKMFLQTTNIQGHAYGSEKGNRLIYHPLLAIWIRSRFGPRFFCIFHFVLAFAFFWIFGKFPEIEILTKSYLWFITMHYMH